ncbi:MAG: hypothetical protein AAF802_18070 [Planctomycetota bacterium]
MTDKPQAEGNFNRRESDRSGTGNSGVVRGGRRKSDRPVVGPRSRFAKYAIAGSFLFSLSLIAWAFTLPFRSGAFSQRSLQNVPEGELVGLEYEAKLDREQYVDFAKEKDQKLMETLRRKNQVRFPSTTKAEVRASYERTVESKRQELKSLREEVGEAGFIEGSIEHEEQQLLESVIKDGPQ